MSKRSPRQKPKRSKPLSQRKAVLESNRHMTDHFVSRVSDIEKRVAQSNKQLWENQKMMNNGLAAAEDHIALVRRVLNDALCGVTRIVTVSRPSRDEDLPGTTEDAQIIDWNWYANQLQAAKGIGAFFHSIDLVLKKAEAKERTLRMVALLTRQETESLHLALTDEAEMKKLAGPVVGDAVPWTPQLYSALRQMATKELEKRDPKPKEDPKPKPAEQMEIERQKLMDEFKQISEISGEAVKAIEAGDEVGAQEAVAKLEAAAKKQVDEDPETAQDFPDGAQIFGGS